MKKQVSKLGEKKKTIYEPGKGGEVVLGPGQTPQKRKDCNHENKIPLS